MTIAVKPEVWLRLAKADGRFVEIDVTANGALSYSGTLPPTEGAQVFLDALGCLISERIKRIAGTKLAAAEAKIDNFMPRIAQLSAEWQERLDAERRRRETAEGERDDARSELAAMEARAEERETLK